MLQILPDSRQIGYEVDGWVGDRPSARCIPSHDRHDLMNITDAMPGCQSTLVTQSRDRQSQQLSQQQGEVTSQYTSKKSAGPGKWQLDKPGQGRHDKDDGGRGTGVRAFSICLSHPPVRPPRACHWCPNSHRSCRSAMKKGKSRSDLPPHLRRRLELQDATRVSGKLLLKLSA